MSTDHHHDEGDAGRLWHRIKHFFVHDHDHPGPGGRVIDTGAEGIRATKVSLAALSFTALIQAAIVVIRGSVALLSDTLHNLTDASPPCRCGSPSPWAGVAGVESVDELRVRWHGHQLRVSACISVASTLSVSEGHAIAHDVEHHLHHELEAPVAATIHVEPFDQPGRHDIVAHHAGPE